MRIARSITRSCRTLLVLAVLLAAFLPVDIHAPRLAGVADAKTQSLLTAHSFGCGAINWQVAPTSAGRTVSHQPTFLVATTLSGEVLLTYIDAQPETPVYYIDIRGKAQHISVENSSGLIYVPDINASGPVWQSR